MHKNASVTYPIIIIIIIIIITIIIIIVMMIGFSIIKYI